MDHAAVIAGELLDPIVLVPIGLMVALSVAAVIFVAFKLMRPRTPGQRAATAAIAPIGTFAALWLLLRVDEVLVEGIASTVIVVVAATGLVVIHRRADQPTRASSLLSRRR